MNRVFIFLLLSISLAFAKSANEIITKVEDNINGKSANMQISMSVYTKKTKRSVKINSLSIGKTKSFMKVLYPKKNYGITFLKLDNKMWQYVPKIERIIKIPASMMLQSWMGSDFTNDDLVRESSISDDYHQKLLSQNENEYKIQLLPKEDASVVWGKIIMSVSKKYYLPLRSDYFDEDGELIRIFYYKDIKKFNHRFYPTHWEIVPQTEDKKGRKTILKIDNVVFDKKIKSSYFTKRALKRYSK